MLLIGYCLVLLACFYLLAVVCEEFFVESLDVIIDRLKLSPDVAGATFMAVGSSAPELFTSLIAVLRPGGHADVGAGAIVGSAIFNILVIIGGSALFKRAVLTWQPVVRDSLFHFLSIVLLLFSFWDGVVQWYEVLSFLTLYGVYIFAVTRWKRWFPYKQSEDPIDVVDAQVQKNFLARSSRLVLSYIIPDVKKDKTKYLYTFFMAIMAIAGLSYALVESAIGIGEVLQISPAIIALTVLAAGTSIPDLLSSIIVAKKGRGDMAVSNAIGSNIFDILFGLGVPWAVVLLASGGVPIHVSTENLLSSIFLLFATVVSVFFVLFLRNWTLGKRAGWILIGLYVLYLGYTVSLVV